MNPLEAGIEIYDWPNRFFVESGYFVEKDYPYPYLVDLEDKECDCQDFQYNIQPNNEPRQCIHQIMAEEYKAKISRIGYMKILPPLKL